MEKIIMENGGIVMANEDITAMSAMDKEKEITGHHPTIIITGTSDKPLFHIVYVSADDGSVHVGFSSYELAFVFQWLKEFFGVDHASVDGIESLRPRGRWETRLVEADGVSMYSHFHNDENCKYYYADHDSAGTLYCPNCGMKMEDGR